MPLDATKLIFLIKALKIAEFQPWLISSLNPLVTLKLFSEFTRFRGHPIERDLYLIDLKTAKWKDEPVPSIRHRSPRRRESEAVKS